MRLRTRILLALLLVAVVGTLSVSNLVLREKLRAQETRLTLLDQETRVLSQQLEAERILAAGQARLLRKLTEPPSSPSAASH